MSRIIINLSKKNIQDLLHNKDITIGYGSETQQLSISIASEEIHASFYDLIEKQIQRLNHDCNYRTAETYAAALNKLRSFREEEDLKPSEITPELMESFQNWLKKQHLSMNTISFHMRKLRAVYNKAVEQGLTIDLHPFRHVYTGIAKTSKRAITINDLKRIKELQLDDPMLEYARDMFLFSFYTRGMAFVDMAYLRKSDVSGNVLTYRRKKTGQQLTIRWERSMQEIAQRYPSKSGYYLLPIIHTHNGKERNQYRHVQTLINESLKTVGEMANINHKLTMYVARHSWASIARQMGVPLNVISHGMGHSNEKTTEIYLKSVDMTIVDEANRNIMQQLDT
jgi:site-specific recombinase XerD